MISPPLVIFRNNKIFYNCINNNYKLRVNCWFKNPCFKSKLPAKPVVLIVKVVIDKIVVKKIIKS